MSPWTVFEPYMVDAPSIGESAGGAKALGDTTSLCAILAIQHSECVKNLMLTSDMCALKSCVSEFLVIACSSLLLSLEIN